MDDWHVSGLGVVEFVAAVANEVFKGCRESRKWLPAHYAFCAQESELIVLNGVHFQRQRIGINYRMVSAGEWDVLEHQRLGVFRNVICSFHLITLTFLSVSTNQERIATSHSM